MVSRKNKSHYTYLVSACLAGINCTYSGKNKICKSIKLLVDNGDAVAVCPEVMGGLGVPREMAEIKGGTGRGVLRGKAAVVTLSGKDVSSQYLKGAAMALRTAKKYGIRKAILKTNSPACGLGHIHDGTFKHVLRRGDGVLAALFRSNKIKVYTEEGKW